MRETHPTMMQKPKNSGGQRSDVLQGIAGGLTKEKKHELNFWRIPHIPPGERPGGGTGRVW